MSQSIAIHATGLVLEGVGVLLIGPSGAGKSLLALALIERWQDAGRPALLVADDRVELDAGPEGLVMHAPPTLAGRIELRGRGIVQRPYVAAAPVHLLVDLVPDFSRMLEPEALSAEFLGHKVHRAPVPQAGSIGLRHQEILVAEAVRAHTPFTKTGN